MFIDKTSQRVFWTIAAIVLALVILSLACVDDRDDRRETDATPICIAFCK